MGKRNGRIFHLRSFFQIHFSFARFMSGLNVAIELVLPVIHFITFHAFIRSKKCIIDRRINIININNTFISNVFFHGLSYSLMMKIICSTSNIYMAWYLNETLSVPSYLTCNKRALCRFRIRSKKDLNEWFFSAIIIKVLS
jgi:hypothetical protein